jgi:hypothetical protein
MVYRVTIGVSVATVVAAGAYVGVALGSLELAFRVAKMQGFFCGLVAALAWELRRHRTASWVLLAAAGMIALLACVLVCILTDGGRGAWMRSMQIFMLQASVMLFGGYFAWASGEAARQLARYPGMLRGKLVATALIGGGVLAAGALFVMN